MIELVEHPFDAGHALNAFLARRSETGAVASFVGLARSEGGWTIALELEAYAEFTHAGIAAFAAAATERFKLQDIHIIHRLGAIPPGDAIVLVLTAATHRREALDGCDFLVDHLKSRAALWKKDHGRAGARWIEPTGRDLADAARWEAAS